MTSNDRGNFFTRLFSHTNEQEPVTISSLFSRETGKASAKWQGYLPQYERWLAPWRDQPVRLLEIGVQAGGSLEVWAEYFEAGQQIIGCDIDRACGQLPYDDPRIKVVIGDVTDENTIAAIDKHTTQFDVIIDDGSHRSKDIIKAFLTLFPKLSDHGIYVVEDLHCSYWDDYGGGLFHPQSALAFFKKLVDVINQPAWGVDLAYQAFLSEFQSMIATETIEPDLSWLNTIHSIEFASSMCMIQKMPSHQSGLGRLVLSGQNPIDGVSGHGYTETALVAPDQRQNLLSQAPLVGKAVDTRLLESFARISELTEEVNNLKQNYYVATKRTIELEQERYELTKQLYEVTKRLYDVSVFSQQLELELAQANLEKPQKNVQPALSKPAFTHKTNVKN
jgi:hypothetical protein